MIAYINPDINDHHNNCDYFSKRKSELGERELRCSECNYLVAYAFTDLRGHIRIKCQKCKSIMILSIMQN